MKNLNDAGENPQRLGRPARLTGWGPTGWMDVGVVNDSEPANGPARLRAPIRSPSPLILDTMNLPRRNKRRLGFLSAGRARFLYGLEGHRGLQGNEIGMSLLNPRQHMASTSEAEVGISLAVDVPRRSDWQSSIYSQANGKFKLRFR